MLCASSRRQSAGRTFRSPIPGGLQSSYDHGPLQIRWESGLQAKENILDIELKESISSAEAVSRLNAVMVEGIEVLSFRQIAEERR